MSHRVADVDRRRSAGARRAAAPRLAAYGAPALSMMVTASASRSPRPSRVTAAGWCRAELDLEVPDSRPREGLVPFPRRASRDSSSHRPARPRLARHRPGRVGSCGLRPGEVRAATGGGTADAGQRAVSVAGPSSCQGRGGCPTQSAHRTAAGRRPIPSSSSSSPARRGRGLLSRGRGRSHLSPVNTPTRQEMPTMNHHQPPPAPSSSRNQTGGQL